jgi:N-methylhydantoinase A
LASVDVKSIGAGGGSIARIDPGGLLCVGPQSAGADPGPACYGRGGKNPTVTDAAVVLGYIDPDYFLGGRMKLDAAAAREVVGKLAQQLGGTAEAAARSIIEVANEHMVGAIKGITINQGLDPREALLVAGGGAAGLNILPIARELGCRQVLVPSTAGALSACGGQFSNIVSDFSISRLAYTAEFPYAAVNETLEEISTQIEQFSARLREKGLKRFSTEYFVEARYPYQVWELDVPLAKGRFDGPGDLTAMIDAFHQEHERVFAVKEPGQQIECLYWRGRLTAFLDNPPLTRVSAGRAKLPPPRVSRSAFFADIGETRVPRFLGEALSPGMFIEGPAMIDEPTTTIVVYPNNTVRVTELHNYLFEVAETESSPARIGNGFKSNFQPSTPR